MECWLDECEQCFPYHQKFFSFHRPFEHLEANQAEASTYSDFIWTLSASYFLASHRRGTGRPVQLPPKSRDHRTLSLPLLHSPSSSYRLKTNHCLRLHRSWSPPLHFFISNIETLEALQSFNLKTKRLNFDKPWQSTKSCFVNIPNVSCFKHVSCSCVGNTQYKE